jgi:hypothetical protein
MPMVCAGNFLTEVTGELVAMPCELELDWNWAIFATISQHMHG